MPGEVIKMPYPTSAKVETVLLRLFLQRLLQTSHLDGISIRKALNRVLPLNLGSILRAIASTLFAATTMGIVVALAQIGLTGLEIGPVHRLAYLVGLGGTVYFILTFKLERAFLIDIRRWMIGDARRGD